MAVVIESITPSALDPTDKVMMRRGAGPLDHTVELVDPQDIADLGGGGATNLAWDASASTVTSDTGTDAVLTVVDNTNPGLAAAPESSPIRYYIFEDYVGGTVDDILQTAATGSTALRTDLPDGGMGWLNFLTGASATGRVAQGIGMASGIGQFPLGGGMVRHRARLRVLTLSTATDQYVIQSGLQDSATGVPVDACYFRYQDDLNGGRFEAVCRSNGVETGSVVDTGVTLAINTTYILEVIVNPLGTSAGFFINGASVATITTNIPTGTARATGAGILLRKRVGTGNITAFCVDYQMLDKRFTAAR